jgi:hypothetical protein
VLIVNDNLDVTAKPTRVPLRGTRVLLFVAFAGFAASVLFAATSLMLHLTVVRFSVAVGLVLLFFGLFKVCIALDAVVAPAAVAPQSDRRQETGSPAVFRLWIAYKLAPAALAIVTAIYLFAVGSAALDGLPNPLP